MYYFKAVGMVTGKEYYFCSSKEESEATNIFPISENMKGLVDISEPFNHTNVVYLLGEEGSPRLAIPCFSEEERSRTETITMESFKTHKISEFLENVHGFMGMM